MKSYDPHKVYRVLIFPGGTEIGLEIHRALSFNKNIALFSAAMDIPNHAPFVFKNHFVVPSIHDKAWISALNQIISDHQIDYIYPAYDDVIVALAENQAKLGARVIGSPLETCIITRSKSLTYRKLADVIPVPIQYRSPDEVSQIPVFVKPDSGQGSQDSHRVDSLRQLSALLERFPESIILEYLPGMEYTVDCFSDREHGLLFCSGRERIRTKNGISMSSRSVHNPMFQNFAQAISEHLVFYGAWFFQVKCSASGELKLLEVAPRVAGTSALHRTLGINFPLLSLFEQERIPIQILTNSIDVEIERALINRYKHNLVFKTVYVDLDDTLIVNGAVNTRLIQFVYQCINQGIRLILITKHAEDLDATLRRYRLAGLFDEVIQLQASQEKWKFMQESSAISIDDSFSERRAIHEQLGVLTFDTSMVEMLIDERL